MSKKTAAWVIGLGFLAFIPIWRCGLREDLNFYQFVLEHTIFSPHPVSYVPEEYLTRGESSGIYMRIL